jgi:hypothetical protein
MNSSDPRWNRTGLSFVCLSAAALVAGCQSTVVPRYSGRVIASKTHKPLAGVSVEVAGVKETATKTNARGEFNTNGCGLLSNYSKGGAVTLRVTPTAKYREVELRATAIYEYPSTWLGREKALPFYSVGDICLNARTTPLYSWCGTGRGTKLSMNAIDALLFGAPGTSRHNPGIIGLPGGDRYQVVERDGRGHTETYWVDQSGKRSGPSTLRK